MSSYLNTEPDLGENESIVGEYPAETYLVRHEDPDTSDETFRFHAPAREVVTFEDEDRARLFADLYIALDGFRVKEGLGPNGVPVTVAATGKSAIAAYMFAAWGSSPTDIARTLEVDRDTVLKYFDQIRGRAEKVVEAANDSGSTPGEAG